MSRLASAIDQCPEGARCAELPSIALQLANEAGDLLITIGQIKHVRSAADGREYAHVITAEQVRCVRGVPRPELFRDAGDPGPAWCSHCRAAFGYAVLGTVYASLASLLRPDLVLDFAQRQPPPAAVDSDPAKA